MKLLILTATLFMLAACGGGSSSSNKSATTETEDLVEAVWGDEENPVSWNEMKWQ